MKQRKYQVSIAISALNEERNIGNVLKEIISQHQSAWNLKEILVYCDGCSDSTFEKATKVKSKKVKVIEGRRQKGKVARVNQAMREFTGDILVIFDADIKLGNANVISALVSQFKKDSDVMFVSGNSKVFPPKTFFERVIYTSYLVYYDARERLKNGHNVFGCSGACIALRRKFAKKVRIPSVINEDTYLYFSCLSMGYKFRHAKKALVFYQLAGNLKDFTKQIFRTHPEAITQSYQKYFGNLIKKEYKRPLGFYFKSILKVFLKDPVGTILMILIKLFCLPLFPFVSKNYKLEWYVAESTKKGNTPKSKKKIAISNFDDLKNPFYAGGGSIAVHEIAKRLAWKNIVTVYTGKYPGAKNEVKDKVFYKRIGLSSQEPRISQAVYHLALPFYAITQKYDLWLESFTPPFSTSFLQVFTKKPVIGLVHMLSGNEMKRKYKLPFQLIEKLGLKTYKRFIVLTEKSKENISQINQHANIKVIPNGVDAPNAKRYGKKDSILFIGRIEVEQKGLDLLLTAFNRVYKKTGVKLVIAGSGTQKEEKYLEKLVEKLKLGDGIEYAGRVSGDKKDEVFARAQLMVIPSRVEAFSLAALEALSYGIPIVSFDIEGLNWLSEKCAYKVKAFNDRELAQAIGKLLASEKLRTKMGGEGKKIAKRFTWDSVFEKYYQFIGQTLALNSKRLSR
jgi:glycosyltransferase involved in cell wall biosynthesis